MQSILINHSHDQSEWTSNLLQIFIGVRCWGLSARTMNQKGAPGAGGEGEGAKTKNILYGKYCLGYAWHLKQARFRLYGTRLKTFQHYINVKLSS